MVSRRAFLRGGSLAGLAALAPVARAQIQPRTTGGHHPFEAVCDTRHAQGDAFLAAVAPRAFRSHGVGVDPGPVLGVVADATAAGRLLIGLTTPTTLMIARQMAAPQGYGLVFHGEHGALMDGKPHHRLHGDDAWLPELAQLLQRSADAWPGALGRSLVGLATERECSASQSVACASDARRDAGAPLVSWVLAPARA
ncbi:MAG: hypothetical protein ACOY6E_04520 [Pseudomonadota bacterium]